MSISIKLKRQSIFDAHCRSILPLDFLKRHQKGAVIRRFENQPEVDSRRQNAPFAEKRLCHCRMATAGADFRTCAELPSGISALRLKRSNRRAGKFDERRLLFREIGGFEKPKPQVGEFLFSAKRRLSKSPENEIGLASRLVAKQRNMAIFGLFTPRRVVARHHASFIGQPHSGRRTFGRRRLDAADIAPFCIASALVRPRY